MWFYFESDQFYPNILKDIKIEIEHFWAFDNLIKLIKTVILFLSLSLNLHSYRYNILNISYH